MPVENDPPAIVVSYEPAIVLSVDGEPVLADIPKTKLKFVVKHELAAVYRSGEVRLLSTHRSALDDGEQPGRSVVTHRETPERHVKSGRGSSMGRAQESDSAAGRFQRRNSTYLL